MFNPQNLITVPRDRDNPRRANMELTEGVEQGGRWYRLIDERDKQKYRILSETEIEEEFDKSKSYGSTMLKRTVQKFATNGHTIASPDSRLRKSVMVGVNSRSRSRETSNWHEELQKAKEEAGEEKTDFAIQSDEMRRRSAPLQSQSSYLRGNGDIAFPTLSSSVEYNTSSSGGKYNYSNSNSNSNNSGSGRGGFGGDTSDGDDSPLVVAIETMSHKYMENVNVIKMLFAEKTVMEDKIKKMERAINRSRSRSRDRKTEDGESLPPEYGDIYDDDGDDDDGGDGHYDTNEQSRGRPRSRRRKERGASANESRGSRERVGRGADSKIKVVDEGEKVAIGAMAAAKMFEDFEKYGAKGRPKTAPLKSFAVSSALQASIDKHLQNQKALKIAERLREAEEVAFQREREEKRIREAMNGKEFEAMEARTREYEAKRKMKEEAIIKEKKEKEDEDFERTIREKKRHLDKPVFKHEIRYEDYIEQQELQRKEKVLKRISELKQAMKGAPIGDHSKNPSSSMSSDGRRSGSPSQAAALKKLRQYQAELKKIVTNLGTQQNSLEKKIEEARNELKFQQTDPNIPRKSINFVASMEARNKMYAAKQTERDAEKQKKEEEKRMKLQQEEALKFQKLLNTKIPEESRKTTRSVSIRANLVKQKLDNMEKSQDMSQANSTQHHSASAYVSKREHKTLMQRQDEQTEITKAHIEAVRKLREIEKDVKAKNRSKGVNDDTTYSDDDDDNGYSDSRNKSGKK